MPATAKGLAERGARFEGAEALNYLDLFRAEPRARIRMVKAGLPAASAKRIISDLDMRGADAAEALHVPISTINRKAKNQDVLSCDESERFIGLARLIGQVQAMLNWIATCQGIVEHGVSDALVRHSLLASPTPQGSTPG